MSSFIPYNFIISAPIRQGQEMYEMYAKRAGAIFLFSVRVYNKNNRRCAEMRIGVDVEEVIRIAKAIERIPEFRSRIFTEEEIAHCEKRGKKRAESYAALWAAREAAGKALGTGFAGAQWKDAHVRHTESGAPELCLEGELRKKADELGIHHISMSLTHEHSCAVAVVVMTGERS